MTDTTVAGTRIWSLWTHDSIQRWELEPADGIDQFQLTGFWRVADADTTDWCSDGPFAGEYYLKYGWAPDSMSLVLEGPNWTDGLELVAASISKGEQDGIPYVQFVPCFQLASDSLEIRLFYRGYLDGFLERWARVTNAATDTISGRVLYVDHLASASRRFSPAGWTASEDARWVVENAKCGQSAQLRTTVLGVVMDLQSWSSDIAWCAVHYDTLCAKECRAAEGFVQGLVQASGAQEWPNATRLERPFPGLLDVRCYNVDRTRSADVDREDAEQDNPVVLPQVLRPGLSAEGSHVYFSFTDGTLDHATLRTDEFMRRHYAPSAPFPVDSMPRVQFLTYFWNDWGYAYDSLAVQAEACAAIGVELFVLDANWWPYSLYNPPPPFEDFELYRHGNGYWVSDPCRFSEPESTLADFFIDEVKARGMDPGLWIYACGVDSALHWIDSLWTDSLTCWSDDPPEGAPCFCDSVDTMRCCPWETGWYTVFGTGDGWKGASSASDCPTTTGRTLGQLCCAQPSAREWMKSQLRRLLDDDAYGARYLKFDGAVSPCISNAHFHRMPLDPGDTDCDRHQPTLLGYYQMLKEMRAEYPQATFESSWPVGHVATVEDPTHPEDMLPRMSRYGMEAMRCAMPPQYAGCFLYREPDVSGLDSTEQVAIRRHYARTPMLGPYTISSNVATWSPEFTAVVAEVIDYYQANRRFLHGEVYNVLTQRSFCGTLSCADSWDAVEFLDPGTRDARVYAFRNESQEEEQTLCLQGFLPGTIYDVTLVDQPGVIASYMSDARGRINVPVTLSYESSSAILEIEQHP